MSVETLQRAFASTEGVLRNVSADQLDLPTPCVSWKVRDVVNHIVEGTTFFSVTAETGTAPPLSDADHTAGDFKAEFRKGADRAVAAFSAPGAMDKIMKLPFGDWRRPGRTRSQENDVFTHGWDLAKATGQSTDLDPVIAKPLLEAAQLIPEEFRGPDGQTPFGPKVDVPASATAADKLAGFMGRRV
jgi:uncharacterized protein (TIGR03086 family)